jgi:hypothetical protein
MFCKERTRMSVLLCGLVYETPRVIFVQMWGIFCGAILGEFCGQAGWQ